MARIYFVNGEQFSLSRPDAGRLGRMGGPTTRAGKAFLEDVASGHRQKRLRRREQIEVMPRSQDDPNGASHIELGEDYSTLLDEVRRIGYTRTMAALEAIPTVVKTEEPPADFAVFANEESRRTILATAEVLFDNVFGKGAYERERTMDALGLAPFQPPPQEGTIRGFAIRTPGHKPNTFRGFDAEGREAVAEAVHETLKGYPDGNPKTPFGRAKPSLSLLPAAAEVLISEAFRDGSDKYGEANWRHDKVSASTYLDACRRHLAMWKDGEEFDPAPPEGSGVHHLAHAAACLCIILDAQQAGMLIDDRPPPAPTATLIRSLTRTRHAG